MRALVFLAVFCLSGCGPIASLESGGFEYVCTLDNSEAPHCNALVSMTTHVGLDCWDNGWDGDAVELLDRCDLSQTTRLYRDDGGGCEGYGWDNCQ